MDKKLEKWLKWLDIIKSEIRELVVAKHTFHEVQKIISDNPELHEANSFYRYFTNTHVSHVSHVVSGVRRQVKCDDQSISLARLLTEMVASPQILSRDYYVSLYKGSLVEGFADKDFNRFADPNCKHIDPDRVSCDLKHLRETSAACEDFADRRVAHRDRRDPKQLPTYKQLDDCIDMLDSLFVRYCLLFHATNMRSLLPTRQHDWKKIFRVPWIPN
jgi:hypothetical protein